MAEVDEQRGVGDRPRVPGPERGGEDGVAEPLVRLQRLGHRATDAGDPELERLVDPAVPRLVGIGDLMEHGERGADAQAHGVGHAPAHECLVGTPGQAPLEAVGEVGREARAPVAGVEPATHDDLLPVAERGEDLARDQARAGHLREADGLGVREAGAVVGIDEDVRRVAGPQEAGVRRRRPPRPGDGGHHRAAGQPGQDGQHEY